MAQVNKLSFVDGKLGAPTSGQQTTRILFHTIENPGTTSSLIFFKDFQGLTAGQTNLTTNKLDSMESMVIKSIYLAQINSAGVLETFNGNRCDVLSIIIGNQTVVKNLPIGFNESAGQAFDRLHENGGSIITTAPANSTFQTVQPVEIRLVTDIVIPPQVSFEVRIDSNSGVFGNGAVVCALSGYGKIFSAGNSF